MDPVGDPFLRTRFALPLRPDTFIRRERLVAHLDRALDTPLTMINGGAGAGKTLLAADWAETLGQPVAWLTCDPADRAPGVFWAYLLQALRASGVRTADEVGSPADPSRVDHTLLARLAAGLSGRERPAVVILDEYDLVTTPEIADQLEFVLRHAGAGLRLVLVTRTEPLLPLHRYRALGTLTEIRDAELAFTPEEAATLLDLHGLRLSGAGVRALVGRTQGWAAGLRLCALAAQESNDPETYLKEFEAGQSAVADFLLAEVLKQQPPETQELLLRVSVLDRFCPDLANAVTGQQDAEPRLAALHRANAFVHHLGHSWYRLHPLFAEILRAHQRVRLPGLERELHRRAAAWLHRSGPLSETLAHGAAAGDWEFTARVLVDDLAIGQLFLGLRSDDLGELFSRMAPDADGPQAHLVRAARALSTGDIEHGLAHLRGAEEGTAPDLPAPDTAAVQLNCALLEALAARLTGSPGRAEQAARKARLAEQDVPADTLERHPELPALLQTHLGSALLWAGRFEEARTALSAAVASPGGAATALPREEALNHLALIDQIDGRPGRAERKARAAISDAERFSVPQPSGSGLGQLVLAAVAVERNELDEAQALLDQAATRHGAPDPVAAAAHVIAGGRLLLARGDAPAALETAESAVAAAVSSPWAEQQAALIASAAHLAEGRPEAAAKVLDDAARLHPACAAAAARALLASGRADEALRLLDDVRTVEPGGPAVTVRALLVRAQAADLAGDTVAALRLVVQALRQARRELLRRPFLEAGPWIRRLLAAEPAQELAADWLTQRPGPPAGGPPDGALSPAPVVEPLSARERDVLQRLAQMMSTEEIAADLFVSVNTVKTHLKTAYRKLGVNRRNDAVRRARELRLM
ncbi:LuxR C-terminal-related transcriptional regulator [Streptomyces tropicalis]|uniref:LuxR C-terminal-related transcriptional regulator n=1 Tax=Streptomyces tropicalis TaxID=3034234 RepID=A0ABT6A4A2_9ACTN|nr:LuxR C-terminal-related transcriptional regulator [Streptomyces tropicalis]MDF3298640.1 LuxR C-terminal-related transcriptional regulator [Streptomyces tropicalis]